MTVLALNFASCADYLDIVPDNTVTIEDYFERKEMAWNALAKVYEYLPNDHTINATSWLLGDEWMGLIEQERNEGAIMGTRIMRGLQNSSNPILGHWTGSAGGRPLYQGIRSANTFLENIDKVEDMSDQEKLEWKGQVKFLKAYYHFLLLRQYGPIVIMDQSVPLDALSEDLFHKRSKLEDCFDYIIRLMNEAIPDIKERADADELGLLDRVGAMAIKARVMLYRASPFFNGNSAYYGDFLDFDGQPFFTVDYNHEKWKDAADAADEAIELCKRNGIDLYTFEGSPYLTDRDDYSANPNRMKTMYDLRMLIVDPWNRELLWGQTYQPTNPGSTLAAACNIRIGTTDEDPIYAYQYMGASYAVAERYYTKNGLPIDEDRSFNTSTMHDIIMTPGSADPEYDSVRGLLQPGAQTIQLYMDREMRFYANLGITGGYWRAHASRISTNMFAGTPGGYITKFNTNYLCTGIGVQKFVHPESKSGYWQRVVRFPYPIIRMADLYLIKAEALNEYLDKPNDEVYEAINKVRRRAGIPDVQLAWANARTANKHLNRDGMRDIILRERSIELAFEGSHFWDMYRHRKAVSEFSAPIMGWKYEKEHPGDFFVLELKQARRFIIKDYLWPISLSETNKNANLIQNPGW
jgi:hypothetical protein